MLCLNRAFEKLRGPLRTFERGEQRPGTQAEQGQRWCVPNEALPEEALAQVEPGFFLQLIYTCTVFFFTKFTCFFTSITLNKILIFEIALPAVVLAQFPTAQKGISGEPAWLSWLSVRLLVSAQVMISWFVSSSPLGLCADSTEPAWDSLSPSLSAPPPACSLKIRNLKKIKKKKKKAAAAAVAGAQMHIA